ncbi:MAG: hypothetical protein OXM54_10530 [Acidimicrobiaceae bacterium]|nr:hypothetical protein [Acidimicrobiaceae bacterium]
MAHQDAFTTLPAGIWLTNDESLAVLQALDIARAAARNHAESRVAGSAILLITRKLWDELADILEMNGDHSG